MRLIEFLQQLSTPVEPTYVYRRIPLAILGGSQKEYNDFVAHRVFENLMLSEAAIDRYIPSIQVFKKIDELMDGRNARFYASAEKELQWAMENLKREDRIVWYMRFAKAVLLEDATKVDLPPDAQNPQQIIEMLRKEYAKHMAKLRRAHGIDDNALHSLALNTTDQPPKQALSHFISLKIPQIDRVVFGKQTFHDLFNEFSPIEKEWMARKSKVINHDEDEDAQSYQKIIEFEDGSAWFNLNRSSCSKEGAAMGHCGNGDGGSNLSSETVLSYRVPVNGDGAGRGEGYEGSHWKPRLTFILDTRNGFLGEMKARNNSKPKAEMHPHIIRLLMSDMIKGIVGGGYKAENNFSLDDLGEDRKEQVLQQKPELGTFGDMLRMADGNVTPALIERVEAQMDQEDVEYSSIDEDQIVCETYSDMTEFLHHHKSDLHVAHYINEYRDGLQHFDHHGGGDHSFDAKLDLAEDAFRKSPDLWKQLQAYMLHTYPDEFMDEDGEGGEYDPDSESDVLTVAMNEDEELYDQLGYAIDDGHQSGAENEMFKAFEEWMDSTDVFEDGNFRLAKEDDTGDGPVSIVVDTVNFIKQIWDGERGEYELDEIAHSGWSYAYKSVNDIQEPHYGWDGYDHNVAIERFIEDANIPKLDHLEVPDGGDASADQATAFSADVKKLTNSETVRDMVERTKTVVRNVERVNGAMVADVHTWGGEFESDEKATEAFTETLKDLAVIATEHGVPFVVRGMNHSYVSGQVTSLGYKQQENGYLRFDPKGNE